MISTNMTDWATYTPKMALEKAIELAGGQQKLGDICGCTQGAISQMLRRKEPRLSHPYVLKVSAALGIPRSVLRPDIYPADDASLAAQAA